jgi:hypothetical protein
MTDFLIKVANQIIGIKSLHNGIFKLCRDYLIDCDTLITAHLGAAQDCDCNCEAQASNLICVPDLQVNVTQAMIDFERTQDPESQNFSDSYLETLAVQRAISRWLPAHGAFLMHGAVITYKGQGIMFCAPSGIGKSTHIKHWRDVFGSDVSIVNGDKPFVRPMGGIDDTGAIVYGTPWAGKEGWQANCAAPLKAICLLGRMDNNAEGETEGNSAQVSAVTAAEVLNRILAQVYIPDDAQVCFDTLGLVDELCCKVKVYDIKVADDPQAARCVCDAIFRS